MDRARFDSVCGAMRATHNVIQWGDASVWKVGGAKGPVFAIHSHWGEVDGVVLKPSELAREIWRDAPGVALAPYLGRAGWIKIDDSAMGEGDLIALIEGSYAINAAKLTKKRRAELGI